MVEWFDRLPDVAVARCRARVRLLALRGHELRRPAAAYLGEGIYELRVRYDRLQLRMLYFFHGTDTIVISHGFAKSTAAVPRNEIERALQYRREFEVEPDRHSTRGPL